MKALGLVASARKLGNSEILVKEMLAALPDNAEKKMIRLPDLNIGLCQACYACLPAEKACVIEDDLAFLLDNIKRADAVIIGTPCYFLGAHTTLKMIGDRLLSITQNGNEFRGKKCIVAVTYGIDGWDGYALEAAVNFARFLHLDVIGSMSVQAASPGEVIRPEVLNKARMLAECLLVGTKDPAEVNGCCCQQCGNSLLKLSADGTVNCPMCGAIGRLSLENGQYVARFDRHVHSRFSLEGMNEHGNRLEKIKDQYLAKRQELYSLRKRYKEYDDWWLKR